MDWKIYRKHNVKRCILNCVKKIENTRTNEKPSSAKNKH